VRRISRLAFRRDPYPLVFPEAMEDPDDIADAAARLPTDETYRSAIGANARRLAEMMSSMGAVVDDIESLYARLISV
jgi:glycosyltransferase involved in cell wall biosynthesis